MASTPPPPGQPNPASSNPSHLPYVSAGLEIQRRTWHGFFVGMILALIVGSTLIMVGFIWYRWHDVREPTTAVIVEGDASLDGTVITVTGERLITTSLKESNNYIAPVLVEPGMYLVKAEHNGVVLIQKRVEVKRFLGVRFDLKEYVKHSTDTSTRPTEYR
jgi:hypothetical protein